MNTPEPDLIQIFNYIEGRLSAEEMEAFRHRISEDDQLKLEVEAYANLSRGLRQEKLEAIEKKMTAIQQKLPPVKKSDLISLEQNPPVIPGKTSPGHSNWSSWINWFFGKTWTKVALPLLVVIGIGWTWTNRHFSNEGLAQKYIQLPQTPDPAGGASAELLFDGYRLFDQGKYREALENFSAISSDDPYYPQAYFFQAHCQFRLGNYEDARAIFDSLIENRNYPGLTDLETLRWNSLMCDLALDSNNWSRAIENAPGEQAEQQDLQKDLQSFWRKIALIF